MAVNLGPRGIDPETGDEVSPSKVWFPAFMWVMYLPLFMVESYLAVTESAPQVRREGTETILILNVS